MFVYILQPSIHSREVHATNIVPKALYENLRVKFFFEVYGGVFTDDGLIPAHLLIIT